MNATKAKYLEKFIFQEFTLNFPFLFSFI